MVSEAEAKRESFVLAPWPEVRAWCISMYISTIITFDADTSFHFNVISKKRAYVQKNYWNFIGYKTINLSWITSFTYFLRNFRWSIFLLLFIYETKSHIFFIWKKVWKAYYDCENTCWVVGDSGWIEGTSYPGPVRIQVQKVVPVQDSMIHYEKELFTSRKYSINTVYRGSKSIFTKI